MQCSTTNRKGQDARAKLTSALWYANLGWPVFPVHSVVEGVCTCRDGRDCGDPGKHPRTRHGFKDATTDPTKIKRWWRQWPDANVGIATGSESGLVVIDVDPDKGGDESLRLAQDRLGILPEGPISKTGGGGRHLLLAHPGGRVPNRIGLADGLDVRGDGGYIVAPRSAHESGNRYEWEVLPTAVPLPDIPLPWLDWILGSRCSTECTGKPKNAHEIPPPGSAHFSGAHSTTKAIEKAIDATLPKRPGQRHGKIFQLVRRLLAIAGLPERPAREHQWIIEEWHRRAHPQTSGKHSFDDYLFDFQYAWAEAKHPWGVEPVQLIAEKVRAGSLPAVANDYDDERLQQLVGVCRELQKYHGDEPFFLDTHTAAEVVGVHPTQAWRWMFGPLRADKVIRLVCKGNRREHRASEWRYLRPLDE